VEAWGGGERVGGNNSSFASTAKERGQDVHQGESVPDEEKDTLGKDGHNRSKSEGKGKRASPEKDTYKKTLGVLRRKPDEVEE